jgi:hypothetical protein
VGENLGATQRTKRRTPVSGVAIVLLSLSSPSFAHRLYFVVFEASYSIVLLLRSEQHSHNKVSSPSAAGSTATNTPACFPIRANRSAESSNQQNNTPHSLINVLTSLNICKNVAI